MSQDLSKETCVLLRAIEESFHCGIYDLHQALEKAFRGGVLCGKVQGLATAKDIIEERA